MFCFYEEQEGGKLLDKKLVIQGLIVAIRRDEEEWFRARVIEVLTPIMQW